MSKFAKGLLREWRRLRLPLQDATAVVGVSGGADSVALLLALDELTQAKKLKIKLIAAHIDHRLRKTSSADARWVKVFATKLGYQVSIGRIDVKNLARRTGDNLEQAARRSRYKTLRALAQKAGATVVLTAHTMDDQAETVLLNLLRGSGGDGLSGMQPVRALSEDAQTVLARPLVSWAYRRHTVGYCRDRKVDFLRDEMNEDETFARVRVRRRLLPVLETFNPRIVDALARTGELLRDDSDALTGAAQRLLELSIADGSAGGNQMRVDLLVTVSPALRRRALRQWLEGCRGDLRRLEMAHIRAVENLVSERRGGRTIELPGGSTVTRKRDLLIFRNRTSGVTKP